MALAVVGCSNPSSGNESTSGSSGGSGNSSGAGNSGVDYNKYQVGDFILKDGTILSKDETSESGTVAAVIVRAAGFAKNITALQGDKTIGYMDGSDGWYLPTLAELYTIY